MANTENNGESKTYKAFDSNYNKEETAKNKVSTFIQNLEQGKFYGQIPNEKPMYPINLATNKAYQQNSFYSLSQGLADRKINNPYVLPHGSIMENGLKIKNREENNGIPVTALGSISARGPVKHKEDVKNSKGEVIYKKGDNMKGPDGKDIFADNFYTAFSCADMMKVKWSKEKGQEKAKMVVVGEAFPCEVYPLPLNINKDIPTFKAKNNTAEDLLLQILSESERGKFLGNFKGVSVSKEQIETIKKGLEANPHLLTACINKADAYARGDEKQISQIEAKRNERAAQQSSQSAKPDTKTAAKKTSKKM